MGKIFQEMLRQEVLSGGTADVVGFYLFLPWLFWYMITVVFLWFKKIQSF